MTRFFSIVFFIVNTYSFVSFHMGSSVYPYSRVDYFERRDLFDANFTGTDEELENFKSEYTASTFFLNLDLMLFLFDSIGVSAKYRNIKNEYYNHTGFLRPFEDAFQFDINSYHFFSIGLKYRLLIPLFPKKSGSSISFLLELDGGISAFYEQISEQLKQKEGFFFTPKMKRGYIAGIHLGILIASTFTLTVGVEAIPLHFSPRNEDFLAWVFPISFSAKIF